MISRVHSSILAGIDAVNCEVEADVAHGGEATIKLVGMAETHRQGIRQPHPGGAAGPAVSCHAWGA